MGLVRENLSSRKLPGKPIFKNRFVVEICEKWHTHYRNLRIVNTTADWVKMAEGFKDALDRWKNRGCPGTSRERHIELCRKKIVSETESEEILINLNENLYLPNKGRVFAEGADFEEPEYIHMKIGDVRIELSLDQFKEVAGAVKEAEEKLQNSAVTA